MLNFLREMPQIYIVFVTFLLLILLWSIIQERELLILANLALGAIIGIATGRVKAAQEIAQQTIERVTIPLNDQTASEARDNLARKIIEEAEEDE